VGVVGWGFCFGDKGVLATVRWVFPRAERVGSMGDFRDLASGWQLGGGGEQWYEGTILVELGLLRRPIIVTPLRTSNLPSLLTCRQEYSNFIFFSLSLSK